jgi:hypothetical protein
MPDWVTFTRQQLYELVWQKPMARLAAEYSISDVGLAKICARSGIPTPPRGYWARLEAGQAPARPRLQTNKERPEIRLPVRSPDAEGNDGLRARLAEEKSPEKRGIVVADRLHSPHELVQQAKEALQVAKENEIGFIPRPPHCLDIQVSRDQLARALRVADALLKAFQERGWDVSVSGDGTVAMVEEMPIALSIEESTENEERPAKPDLSGSYSFHHERRDFVRKPSGCLSICIREERQLWGYSQQRNWKESEKRPIEECLNKVVAGMVKLAAAVREDRARREREAREAAERQRLHQAALDEQQRLRAAVAAERSKVDTLRKQAELWREAENLRRFVEEARRRGPADGSTLKGSDLDRWGEWALAQADRLDPFTRSPPSILDDAERIERMVDDARARR